ncbi:hypothetical protein FB451DRAFT_1372973 [Mycena latifolia]|nr:hypothetical protein FB451DRAFT_1372973 [Mycena latifolia]
MSASTPLLPPAQTHTRRRTPAPRNAKSTLALNSSLASSSARKTAGRLDATTPLDPRTLLWDTCPARTRRAGSLGCLRRGVRKRPGSEWPPTQRCPRAQGASRRAREQETREPALSPSRVHVAYRRSCLLFAGEGEGGGVWDELCAD